MAREIAELEHEIRQLGRSEQERLLRTLLEELDGPIDPGAERGWLEEVERRSSDFDAGRVRAIPAEEVFEGVRSLLKQ
jgi:putative addiction module component (TIGR02574 family)